MAAGARTTTTALEAVSTTVVSGVADMESLRMR